MNTSSLMIPAVAQAARRATVSVLCWSVAAVSPWLATAAVAQAPTPRLQDNSLQVRAVVSDLSQPTSMAFLGANDLLVLEKDTGKVQRVVNGVIQGAVLDLAVNTASERGLLGIALHPDFPRNPGVYLFWTESSTGFDSTNLAETPLLGNRVDRFVWNGGTLTQAENIIRMRALQEDEGQPARGNHNGGVLRFGPDRKLYIYTGDRGRRGQMQNLPDGPGPAGNQPDDQLGGPEPDDAHLAGVILRLNDDGSSPEDNPFFSAGATRGGEAGTNLQKVFAYGIRNGFGMAFDPESGRLWEAQNGDDSFSELNRVSAGDNLGWIQVMGPMSRLAEFKEIETSPEFLGLQQVRWPPSNIADDSRVAMERLFTVFDGGNDFAAELSGADEVPAVASDARALVRLELQSNGELQFTLWADRTIQQVTAAHIHLGAAGQNGPVAALLFQSATPQDFQGGQVIARGTLTDANVVARPGFEPTIANLAERLRQGRGYANVHTTAHPAGEVRGQLLVMDRRPLSQYSDPEFSWKYEVAPAGIGFVRGRGLGPRYDGDLIIGAARPNVQEGHLFRFQLSRDRRNVEVRNRELDDGVADNLAKYDITESESLLFGTGFGVGTDIHTGPNGNLFVVSFSHGSIYEISRRGVRAGQQDDEDREDDEDDEEEDEDDEG